MFERDPNEAAKYSRKRKEDQKTDGFWLTTEKAKSLRWKMLIKNINDNVF